MAGLPWYDWSLRSREGRDTPSVEEWFYWQFTPGSTGEVIREGPDNPEYLDYWATHNLLVLGGLSLAVNSAYFSGAAGLGATLAEYRLFAAMAPIVGAWQIATTPALLGAVGAGLVLGVAAGASISGAIWGPEGSEMAMDFYSGRGDHAGYFDISGNFGQVWSHYF